MNGSMNEPRRLLSTESTSSLGRSLLIAGRARREPEGARDRVWGAIAAGAAVTSLAPALQGTSASTKVVAVFTKAKLLAMGALVVGTATVGSIVVLQSRDEATPIAGAATTPSPPTSRPVMALLPATSSVVAAPSATIGLTGAPRQPVATPVLDLPNAPPGDIVVNANAAQPPKTKSATRAAPPTHVPGAAPSEVLETKPEPSELGAEAELLAMARADLARGDAASAMRRLADAKIRFANGRLTEERDALEVRAAEAAGDPRRAIALGRAFLQNHPKSPLRSSIEPITKE